MKFGVKLILSIIFFNHTCSKFGYLVYLASTLRFLILWLIFIKFPQLIIHHLPLPISLLYQAQVIYLHERNFPSRTNKYAVFTTSVTKCHIFANKFFFFFDVAVIFPCSRVCLISLHYSFIHPTNTCSPLCIIVFGTEDETGNHMLSALPELIINVCLIS